MVGCSYWTVRRAIKRHQIPAIPYGVRRALRARLEAQREGRSRDPPDPLHLRPLLARKRAHDRAAHRGRPKVCGRGGAEGLDAVHAHLNTAGFEIDCPEISHQEWLDGDLAILRLLPRARAAVLLLPDGSRARVRGLSAIGRSTSI